MNKSSRRRHEGLTEAQASLLVLGMLGMVAVGVTQGGKVANWATDTLQDHEYRNHEPAAQTINKAADEFSGTVIRLTNGKTFGLRGGDAQTAHGSVGVHIDLGKHELIFYGGTNPSVPHQIPSSVAAVYSVEPTAKMLHQTSFDTGDVERLLSDDETSLKTIVITPGDDKAGALAGPTLLSAKAHGTEFTVYTDTAFAGELSEGDYGYMPTVDDIDDFTGRIIDRIQ